MSDEIGLSLVLKFDADGDFVRGFEAGRLWEMLKDTNLRDDLIGQPLHASNAEMVLRMAEALELQIAAEPQDETWIAITGIEDGCPT